MHSEIGCTVADAINNDKSTVTNLEQWLCMLSLSVGSYDWRNLARHAVSTLSAIGAWVQAPGERRGPIVH